MSFTKIKLTKGQVALEWVTEEGPTRTDQHEHRLTSFELPHPGFLAAMEGFKRPVLDLLELPSMYGDGLAVTGISITHEDDRGRGLVITCQKQVAGAPAPLIFNTPYLPEDAGEHGQSLPEKMIEALDVAVEAAGRFLQGERAQGDLFAREERVAKAAADPRVRRAVEGLRPKKGSGIESVEITSNGKGVRLTAETTERI